jgi:prevent-host-death family protein
MNRPATGKTANSFDRALDRVRRGERVVLRRGRKPVAVVVPIGDLKRLQELEDLDDARESAKRLVDPREKRIPYKVIRKQAGLS